MPKPSELPIWATDETNNAAPSGGQKATGWTANQVAVSSYFNWLLYTIYLWIVYLDAGVWTGPISITGGLTTDALTVTGAATVGTTLDVTGLATFDADVAVVGDVGASNYSHTTAFRAHLPTHLYTTSSGCTVSQRAVTVTAGVFTYYTPIMPLRVGDRLLSVIVMMTAKPVGTLSVNVYQDNDTGIGPQSVATATDTGTGTVILATPVAGNDGLVAVVGGISDRYYATVAGNFGSGVVTSIEFTWDHPA